MLSLHRTVDPITTHYPVALPSKIFNINYKKKLSCCLRYQCRDLSKLGLFPMDTVRWCKCPSVAECMKKAKRFSELLQVGSIFHKMFNLTVT